MTSSCTSAAVPSTQQAATAAPLEAPVETLREVVRRYATCAAGPDSRFGLIPDDLMPCKELLATSHIQAIGFHVFSGSQILSSEGIIHHLRGGVDLALRTADRLGIVPEIIDLGGGF